MSGNLPKTAKLMNKIVNTDSFLPYFIDEEFYVVDQNFKDTEKVTEVQLGSVEDDESNAKLPLMVQRLLVILRFQEDHTKAAQFKVFLTKLLAAAGFKLDRTDVVVMNKYKDTKAKTIINQSECEFVMAFGVDVKNPDAFSLRMYNGKQVLIASPIELLQTDRAKKTKLWSLMKDMFKLD